MYGIVTLYVIQHIPTAEQRDVRGLWNIEMKYEFCDENGIHLTLYDHDNLGFTCSFEYVLEKKRNDKWIQVLRKDYPYEPAYVIPQTDQNYINTPEVCIIPEDFKLAPGHYRVTKVLCDREFTVEFDLNA